MEEIEQCLDRNRQLRTFASPMEPNDVCHFVQRTMHKLNNNCELYGLDECGRDAELKKIVFHKLGKLITKCGDNFGTVTNSNGGKDHADPNADGDGHDQSAAKVADQLADRIEHLTDTDSERFVCQFVKRLADQEGVQIQPEHRQAPIDQQKCVTNKRLGVALREDLVALVDKYQKEFAWSHLFATVHQCLVAEDALEMFHIQPQQPFPTSSFSSCSTRTRKKEVMFRGSNSNHSGGANIKSHHRPESAIVPSDDARLNAADAMAAVLMSRSVVGDFVHSNCTSDGSTTDWPTGEDDQLLQLNNKNNNLIHLAKQRPKPARLNRSRIQPTMMSLIATPLDEEHCLGTPFSSPSLIANGNVAPVSASIPSPTATAAVSHKLLSTSPTHQSNNCSSSCFINNNDDAPLPPSPLLPHCVRPTPSSPPVVPPRREKMGAGYDGCRSSSPMTPPKLPPKPPASPAVVASTAGGRAQGEEEEDEERTEQ